MWNLHYFWVIILLPLNGGFVYCVTKSIKTLRSCGILHFVTRFFFFLDGDSSRYVTFLEIFLVNNKLNYLASSFIMDMHLLASGLLLSSSIFFYKDTTWMTSILYTPLPVS